MTQITKRSLFQREEVRDRNPFPAQTPILSPKTSATRAARQRKAFSQWFILGKNSIKAPQRMRTPTPAKLMGRASLLRAAMALGLYRFSMTDRARLVRRKRLEMELRSVLKME